MWNQLRQQRLDNIAENRLHNFFRTPSISGTICSRVVSTLRIWSSQLRNNVENRERERYLSGLAPANLDGGKTWRWERRERRIALCDCWSNEDKSKMTARDPMVGETAMGTGWEKKREIRMSFSSVRFGVAPRKRATTSLLRPRSMQLCPTRSASSAKTRLVVGTADIFCILTRMLMNDEFDTAGASVRRSS